MELYHKGKKISDILRYGKQPFDMIVMNLSNFGGRQTIVDTVEKSDGLSNSYVLNGFTTNMTKMVIHSRDRNGEKVIPDELAEDEEFLKELIRMETSTNSQDLYISHAFNENFRGNKLELHFNTEIETYHGYPIDVRLFGNVKGSFYAAVGLPEVYEGILFRDTGSIENIGFSLLRPNNISLNIDLVHGDKGWMLQWLFHFGMLPTESGMRSALAKYYKVVFPPFLSSAGIPKIYHNFKIDNFKYEVVK